MSETNNPLLVPEQDLEIAGVIRTADQGGVRDARLEALAKEIEELQTTAILRIAERLAEAREIFRYRRDEGGAAMRTAFLDK